ncbi:iron-sulfur cluster assembly scaffold protein, partial [Patescibacteria group bacterium]|nr:iron-sulfur cluster assembly scaffold protein [Patescibacteria group bacterium]
ERKDTKTVFVYLYSAKIARFFKQLFGNGAEHKKLPDFIINLPAEKQKSLIYGLWRGDGYINLNRDGPRAGYATISYNLAQQIKILLLRQKIAPSIYTEKEKTVNGVKHKKAYRIHVGQRDSLLRLCSILNIEYKPRSYPAEKAWFDNNYVYIPITGIKKKEYRGNVYNLEVKNSRSFASEAFCLHNCGDVMWLYIKVDGKEVIKDIKFETFGCVAAISTSSIITDLAKGKTIKKALEITKDKVINSLGGLPKIKIHCSVLAVDALAEAIFDYLSKNKKPIPEELKQRHQRIKKEKEIIEKRFTRLNKI